MRDTGARRGFAPGNDRLYSIAPDVFSVSAEEARNGRRECRGGRRRRICEGVAHVDVLRLPARAL